MSKKVSIITTLYNSESFIEEYLDNILSQTYQNIEVIIVDDGSSDDSLEIVKDYSKNHKNIVVIPQKNAGLSAARNTGIKKVTGDYITFVDADDKLHPNMISAMIKSIEKTGSDIAVCSFQEIFKNKTVHFNTKPYPQRVMDTKEALKSMLKEEGFMVSATMKLYPTSFFKNISFPVGKLHEDIGTTYKLIMKANQIVFLPEEYYYYIHRGESIISQKFNERKFDIIALTDTMCDDIDKEFPDLINVTRERRMRARFSVLRQIPINHKQTSKILQYLRTHKAYIYKNTEATKKDKIALRLALFNPRLFKLAYKLKS